MPFVWGRLRATARPGNPLQISLTVSVGYVRGGSNCRTAEESKLEGSTSVFTKRRGVLSTYVSHALLRARLRVRGTSVCATVLRLPRRVESVDCETDRQNAQSHVEDQGARAGERAARFRLLWREEGGVPSTEVQELVRLPVLKSSRSVVCSGRAGRRICGCCSSPAISTRRADAIERPRVVQ